MRLSVFEHGAARDDSHRSARILASSYRTLLESCLQSASQNRQTALLVFLQFGEKAGWGAWMVHGCKESCRAMRSHVVSPRGIALTLRSSQGSFGRAFSVELRASCARRAWACGHVADGVDGRPAMRAAAR